MGEKWDLAKAVVKNWGNMPDDFKSSVKDVIKAEASYYISSKPIDQSHDQYLKEKKKSTNKLMNSIGNNFDTLPYEMQNYVIKKGKEKLADEHPIVDFFSSEKTKENLIKRHLKSK